MIYIGIICIISLIIFVTYKHITVIDCTGPENIQKVIDLKQNIIRKSSNSI